ncbi:UPF0547 protein C16orf87 homolog isoform X2 [Corticium candelabrum]|uniref:UPF0547 protein C16orf87 homolog isoform X2 n=1 Tax=Corticium candelabrum TaxID=121492 RepID=UPI002E277313|nr:UPF0547 protein C16orf87 homolog isoform X2 [Corticium candelabrum]
MSEYVMRMRLSLTVFVMSSVVRVKKCPKCASCIPVACKRCATCSYVFIPRKIGTVAPVTVSTYAARFRRRLPASRYSPELKQKRSSEDVREMETDSSESSEKRRGTRPRNFEQSNEEEKFEVDETEEVLRPPKHRAQAFRLILIDINRKLGHRQTTQVQPKEN